MHRMIFTNSDAVTTLLTAESLLLAVFALAFRGPSPAGGSMSVVFSRRAATAVAATLTVLAAGAAVAWGHLFFDKAPAGAGWFPLLAIGVAIVAEPTFAWAFRWSLRRGSK
jgi:hypothetical protein